MTHGTIPIPSGRESDKTARRPAAPPGGPLNMVQFVKDALKLLRAPLPSTIDINDA
jgi:hypothetical protein